MHKRDVSLQFIEAGVENEKRENSWRMRRIKTQLDFGTMFISLVPNLRIIQISSEKLEIEEYQNPREILRRD